MVALNGLNESGHGPSAFLVSSVESFKPPASQVSDELSLPPKQIQLFKSDLNPFPVINLPKLEDGKEETIIVDQNAHQTE
jgi:hypothetical protein